MYRLIFILLTGTILLPACATLKKPVTQADQIAITPDNLRLLEGTYRPVSGNHIPIIDSYDPQDRFTIECIAQTRLRITLLNGEKVVKTRVLKGKVRDGYFTFRRRIIFVPAIVLNFYRSLNMRIGILQSGDLTLDMKAWIFCLSGMLPIPIIDTQETDDLRFEKM